MAEKHSIRNGTIAGLLVVIITAFTEWMWSWLGSAWRTLEGAIVAAWTWLAEPINILRAVVIGVCVVLLALATWKVRREHTRRSRAPTAGTTSAHPLPPLSQLESAIIHALVRANGRPISYENFEHHVNANNVRITEALDSLLDRRLIDVQHNIIHGAQVYLSKAGRRHAIDNGLA